MRILYLTEEAIRFSEPMVRGGAIHVRNVVEGLRERGHDVYLVDWNDSPERPYQRSVRPRFRFGLDPTRTFARAVSVGRAENVEVVVSKTRKTYLPGLLAARRLGVPHVVHVGSSPGSTGPSAGVAQRLLDRLDGESFRRRLLVPHDAYFVVGDHIGAALRREGIPADRLYDVKNAVDLDRFDPSDHRPLGPAQRRLLGERDAALRLGFVGGIHEYKGVHDLAAAVERADADVSVVVAGDGPERDRLERRLGDDGVFLGLVPYDEVPAVFDALDVFVLPSHTEGMPRVVLESQAMATPVVATRVGGVPELVADGETGLLCDPHSPGELAAAIDELAGDESRRRELGMAGRRAVEGGFAWSEMYDRYERALGDVLDGTE